MYSKAIDDFANKFICLCSDGEFMRKLNDFPATTILELAEKLKEEALSMEGESSVEEAPSVKGEPSKEGAPSMEGESSEEEAAKEDVAKELEM